MNDRLRPAPGNNSGLSPPVTGQANGYPYAVPYPVPVIPPGVVDHVISLEQRAAETVLDNERLRDKLKQKQLAEEAYTSSLQIAEGCICTQSKNGILIPILNCTVRWAARIIPLPPQKDEPFYIIQLSLSDQQIYLTEEEFFKDQGLIIKLQEVPGVKVTIRKTRRTTADLLRQAIAREMRKLPASIYAGWSKQGNGKYAFTAFEPFSSHRTKGPLVPCGLLDTSPAVIELAVRRWMPAYSLLLDPLVRWILMVWSHMAFLTSLLDKLGHRPPLGLYIFCDSPSCMAYLHRLLCWYGDPALSMDMPSRLFVDGALVRKDQPMVIEDAGRTRYAKTNAATVEEMLVSHSLPWKNGRDVQYLPIRALPTILSSTVSGVACDPGLITLDLTADQLSADQFPQVFPNKKDLEGYLTAFANYTEEHIEALRALLGSAHKEAWTLANDTLAEAHVVMLGIMLGLSRFLRSFYGPILPEIEAPLDELLTVLRGSSDKAELSAGLSDQFIAVARAMIQHKQLKLQPLLERRAAGGGSAMVYFDEDSLYFTKAALQLICEQSGKSRPLVLRALADAELIQGAPINRTTVMTRIRLCDVYGRTQDVPVYRLKRDAFETLGDPLLLEEGVES